MPPLTRSESKTLGQREPTQNADSDSEISLSESIQVEIIEIEQVNTKAKPKRQRRAPRQIRKFTNLLFKSINLVQTHSFAAIRSVKVPQQRFNTVYKSLTTGQSVLATPIQSESKRTCNRLILSELDCYYAMQDGIHPESTTRLMIEMRNSVENGDWVSLAKYITIFADVARDKKRWYPTLLRVSHNRRPMGLPHCLYSCAHFLFAVLHDCPHRGSICA